MSQHASPTKSKKKPAAKRRPPKKAHPTTLVIRTCPADMTVTGMGADGRAYGPFVWPRQGPVEALDWDPTPTCGFGLHGLAWGEGDWLLLSKAEDAVWQVVEVATADIVPLVDNGHRKCKFPRGDVVFSGSRVDATIRVLCGSEAMSEARRAATQWQAEHGHASTAASSGHASTAASSGGYSTAASCGDYSKAASSGHASTAASSGVCSKASSSGYSSTAASSGGYSTAASSGDYSTAASSGGYSTAASSGYSSKSASSGHASTAASSGGYSTAASCGDYSKAASSGHASTAASSGVCSKASSSGDSGIAVSLGNGGAAKAGPSGLVIVTYWVDAEARYRACVGNVGEDGILADTWYVVRDGKLVVQ